MEDEFKISTVLGSSGSQVATSHGGKNKNKIKNRFLKLLAIDEKTKNKSNRSSQNTYKHTNCLPKTALLSTSLYFDRI
ncbi:hypothetical protein B9Z19DRAFT_1093311 [Tuber borchii]|uniref:Uncharacterized protein n=1 Tax=Tuber borchii TaxID=42251 RepID=A0A2T6ZFH9_TUBBO|nr:hypothetical protein B9Z19DRAFT_1093311 [Tuber borchii]